MAINPQAPSAVVMIRPHYFSPNPETLSDNSYQSQHFSQDQALLAKQAYDQVSLAQQQLQDAGINVHVFEDLGTQTPDSVFPNNWFSTHLGGHVAIYPMYAKNRRKERRTDIIDMLKAQYRVQDVIDYSGLEYDNIFLEGTGAMVLDHVERVAYAVRSKRTDSLVLERFCTQFNFEPMVFDAEDEAGVAIYHTNVLMCIGSDFVMAGFGMIKDSAWRQQIIRRFQDSGRSIIELTESQIRHFCGNALELQSKAGRILALSKCAYDALTDEQIGLLSQSVTLLPLDVSAIELAGGSVRCMLAGIHLSKR
ncbi:citrulline utilization hydrolase CtlX [Shewanella sp. OMA3-2]|uniref:citrulline utilization hydrolase CtlX n=1 Tax=Shewanella sp. OMA3-2 TaxID=2908650 RepID=UPI001F3B3B4F|nr:arginine deiminase-related protein [Shewanella sp. OMA3-2]UJF22791.1 arginine deiminase-related protein [Shewanella sp. OMA3-2]